MDKPRLTYIVGVKQWRCIGGIEPYGYGHTMKEAYNNWVDWRRIHTWENA